METYSSVAKRKKRKTRKCLDEIRKRSRRNGDNTLLEQSPVMNIATKATNLNGIKPNICITSNRLTLAMFPKVIRSETITRPILSEISEDPVMNVENIIKNTKSTNNAPSNIYKLDEPSHSDSDYIKYSEDNSISSTCERFSAVGAMSIQKDSDSGNLSTQDNNSARSFLLFSPAHQREDSELFEVSPETLSTSSTSSHSSQGSYGYQLYEEFMSEIPVYLKQNTPALIKDDVMKRTKSLLHEIYLESYRRESEKNILHSMRKSFVRNKCYTPKETAVRSPVMQMDYLRIKRPRADPDRHTMYDKPDHHAMCNSDKPDCHAMYDSDKPDHHTMYDSDKPGRHTLYDKPDRHTMYDSDKPDRHNIYDKTDHHTMYDSDKSERHTVYNSDKPDCHTMYDSDKLDRHTMYDSDKPERHTMYDSDKPERHTMYNSDKPDCHTMYDSGKPDRHTMFDKPDRHSRHTIYDRPNRHTMYNRPDSHTMYNTPDYTYYPHKLNQ